MKHQPKFEGARVEWPESVARLEPERIGRQEIFDRVVAHYRAQPSQCSDISGVCAYRRGPLRCFGGALIDDEHYDKRMEGLEVDLLVTHFPLPKWFRANAKFIRELQYIHDNRANWIEGRMEMVLALFATERGLTLSL